MFARILTAFLLAALPLLASGPQSIAVLSAFRPELKAVESQMVPAGTPVKSTTINGTRFDEADIHGHHFVFTLTGQSMVNAAMNTQLVVDRFHVDAVVFCGIAGGINPNLHPGDVIIPAEWIHQMESIWANPDPEHPGKHILPTWWTPKYGNFHEIYPNDVSVVRDGMSGPQDVHAFPADPDLLHAASQATTDLKLEAGDGSAAKIVVGGAGMSGPVFLDNAKFRSFAYETWHVNGHDMESTAIAQVGWVNHVPVLIIRGLCDLAGGQAGPTETGKYLDLAARNAATVTAHTLLDISGDSKPSR
jgi:adenosylhomocysteine nucleosidase